MTAAFGRYALTPVVGTDSRFADFKPYVPSIQDDGLICFQAGLRDGRTGVFTADGETVMDLAVTATESCPLAAFTSHPDLNGQGHVTVYGRLASGEEVLALLKPGTGWEIVGPEQGLYGIGPLGPTMNARGEVAFRATTRRGTASLQLWRDGQLITVAEADDRFGGFAGLPVVNGAGDVTFRASLRDGREAVFVRRVDGTCVAVAATGGVEGGMTAEDGGHAFDDIAPFPTMNDLGHVAFVARLRGASGWGVFIAKAGGLHCWAGPDPAFESYRGILLNSAGPVVFYGTPAGGRLGIYSGPDPARHRIVGLGDPLLGSTVTDFALNPVSVNERGQFAVRVALQNGQQWVLRGDPT